MSNEKPLSEGKKNDICKATKMKFAGKKKKKIAETWISTNGPSQDLPIIFSFFQSNVESQ